jgi:predicted ATP-grasp superfamily ATP-dependent carboligase
VRVLVLDGNENQSVAAVRSLARSGFEVLVGAPTSWSKAGWSRYGSGTFRYTPPQQDAEAFVRDVARSAAEMRGTLVMPMTERTTLPLSERRAVLEEAGATYVLPSHENLLRAMDKHAVGALAASLGVSVPRTELLCDAGSAERYADAARYPVVLKPRSSEETDAHGAIVSTGQPRYARSRGQFLDAFHELRRRARTILAQEFVEGHGAGYFALMRKGDLRAEFAHRRIRDVRPTGSGSALRKSVPVDPRVREASLAILRALEWHGVAMVEFRVRADGTPVLLEVNGRFWNSLALPVHAGVDFPSLVARLARDGDVPPVTMYTAGVHCHWWLGDVRHLVAVIRGRPRGYEGHFPARLPTIAHFLTPVPGAFHDNFAWNDPLPELGDWLDFAFRRFPRAWRSRSAATRIVPGDEPASPDRARAES